MPAAAPTANASSTVAEPVAPVTAGVAGDADSTAGTRRRRRRGSRRRSDRLGQPGEGGFAGEGGGVEPGSAEELNEEDEEEVAAPSPVAPVVQPGELVGQPDFENVPGDEYPPAGPDALERELAPTPAPRSRRRTTRRPAAAAEAAPAAAEESAPVVPEAVQEPLEAMPPADDAVPPEGAQNGEAPTTPTRTPRPRRVASASRGRRTR
jgi:ribonuclease E